MSGSQEWLRSENQVASGVGPVPQADGVQASLQLHPSSSVTSTDYETAVDATETSSYFSAQGYLSR